MVFKFFIHPDMYSGGRITTVVDRPGTPTRGGGRTDKSRRISLGPGNKIKSIYSPDICVFCHDSSRVCPCVCVFIMFVG